MNNRERKFVYKLAGYDNGVYMIELEETIDRLKRKNKKLKQENKKLNKLIDKIRKVRNANTHVEDIYYAEGVLLNEPYCDIEDVNNEELLDILRGDE